MIDKYIKALDEETEKSPNSSNLKTYVRMFGHETAFSYFQSYDYSERKKNT